MTELSQADFDQSRYTQYVHIIHFSSQKISNLFKW